MSEPTFDSDWPVVTSDLRAHKDDDGLWTLAADIDGFGSIEFSRIHTADAPTAVTHIVELLDKIRIERTREVPE